MRAKTDEFALQVNRPEDLPEPFRPAYLEAHQNGDCRQAIFAPQLTNLPQRHEQAAATANLLMVFDEHLFIATKRDSQPVEKFNVPLTDVLCVELGEVLLFCWMRIVFGHSVCEEIKIPFNLVKADLFAHALSLIRPALDARPGSDLHPIKPELDLKFTNVLHHWMHREEVVIKYAFQPEIRARHLIFFRRQVAPTLLAVLTDRQFMLIAEEPSAAGEELGKFTEVYTYCPLSRIKSLTIEPCVEREGLAEFRLILVNGNARFTINSIVSTNLMSQFGRLCRFVINFVKEQRTVKAGG